MSKKISKTAKIVLVSILLAAVLAGAGFGIFAIWAVNTDNLKGTDIRLIAHRGLSGTYTENTNSAFQEAANSDAFYGIETDVHVTKDGYLVCNHDEELHLSDGTDMIIADHTFEELLQKYVKSKFEENQTIPRFLDYLKICKESGKRAIIELKAPLSRENLEKMLKEAESVVGKQNITVISFHFDQIELVRELDANVYSMYLVKNPFEINRALQNNYSIGVFYLWATAPMVADFHKKGLEVNAWTCNDRVQYAMMKIAGVDYITTDFLP